jgi:hypothetical protein
MEHQAIKNNAAKQKLAAAQRFEETVNRAKGKGFDAHCVSGQG